jgi:hypothetical protein
MVKYQLFIKIIRPYPMQGACRTQLYCLQNQVSLAHLPSPHGPNHPAALMAKPPA